MIDHWGVHVEINGEIVLSIESNCLSGKDLSPEEEDQVESCALHLLSFLGRDNPNYF